MAERRRKQRRSRNRSSSSEKRSEERRQGDRRRHERVAAEIMVEVETSGQRTYRRTGNISLGGLGFHAPIPFRMGSTVRMTLRLAGRGGAVPVKGEVVGTDETGRGTRVRFVDLPVKAERRLVAHLKLFDMPTVIGKSPLAKQVKSEQKKKVREGILIVKGVPGEFRLRGTDKVVGRDKSLSDLIIDNRTVSRRHAHIYMQNGRHVISDLSSTNGLHFRHKPVHSLVLKDGMIFKIGKVEVQYLVTRVV